MTETVHLKKKVTLREKQSDVPSNPPKKWPKILIPILVVAVIAVFAIVFWPKGDKGCDEQIAQNVPENVQSAENNNSTDDNVATVNQEEVGEQPTEQVQEDASATEENASEPIVVENPVSEKPAVEQPAPAVEKPSKPTTRKVQTANNPTSVTAHASGTLSGDIEQDAKAVIRGDFGNGEERKAALGDSYTKIQNRVNEIYKENGQF